MRPGKAKGPATLNNTGGGGGASNPWHFLGNYDNTFFHSSDATSLDLLLTAIPANTVLEAARILTRATFVNTVAPTFVNLKLGITGALDYYLPAYNAMTINTHKAAWFFDEQAIAGWNLRIGADSDSNFADFSAGSVDIWIKYWTLPAGS